jgi:hypothetical protein
MHCLEIGLMSSNKIAYLFVPHHNTGGHFINWSLHYLTGLTHYWDNNNALRLVEDCVDDLFTQNFHHHTCKIIKGYSQVRQFELDVLQDSSQPMSFVYTMVQDFTKLVESMFTTTLSESTHEQRQQATDCIGIDTIKTLQWIQNNHALIVFDYDKHDLLNTVYNDRCPLNISTSIPTDTSEEAIQIMEDLFFDKAKQHFDDNIWDIRERRALTLPDPDISKTFRHTMINQYQPHLYYSTDDLWNDFPNVIVEIIEYLKLSLHRDRLVDWHRVYSVWREKHCQSFSRNFDKIVDAIINGYYMNLSRYNMNPTQEALIQGALIKKHNLNIKTWQLEKFPTNTQDLHKLLEPNIHTF